MNTIADRPIRTVIVGMGNIASIHIAAIQAYPDAELIGVCDIDPGKKARAEALCGHEIPFFENYSTMVESLNPDCVHICLPHDLHEPAAFFAASRGCNVFLEKPMALDTDGVRRFRGSETRYGVRFCICLQNRMNNTSIEAHRILSGGLYGKILGVRGIVTWHRDAVYYATAPWRGQLARSGGGLMMNQAIHTLDLMHWLSGGGTLVSVRSLIGNVMDLDIEVEDSVVAHMDFSTGVEALFVGSNGAVRDFPIQVDIVCEQGTLHIADGKLVTEDADGRTVVARDEIGWIGKACYGTSHHRLVASFYDVLRKWKGSYINTEDAEYSVVMADLIRTGSLHTSEAPGTMEVQNAEN